jgi:protein-S-isoprenylcysteine O-methyltransferase Ste14
MRRAPEHTPGWMEDHADESKAALLAFSLMDDRTLRIGVLLAAHIIFLSAFALRIIRGRRGHLLRSRAAWWLQYYPPLVWLPFVLAYALPLTVELADGLQFAGVVIAVASALFAAWAMWSLGRSYGIRMDLFEGHRLVTEGPYRLVRHPMYLGILAFHIGAIFAMESLLLLAATAFYVVPFTAARIVAEDRVLREGFGAKWAAFSERVPALVPFAR